jgi:hypothetical protein
MRSNEEPKFKKQCDGCRLIVREVSLAAICPIQQATPDTFERVLLTDPRSPGRRERRHRARPIVEPSVQAAPALLVDFQENMFRRGLGANHHRFW